MANKYGKDKDKSFEQIMASKKLDKMKLLLIDNRVNMETKLALCLIVSWMFEMFMKIDMMAMAMTEMNPNPSQQERESMSMLNAIFHTTCFYSTAISMLSLFFTKYDAEKAKEHIESAQNDLLKIILKESFESACGEVKHTEATLTIEKLEQWMNRIGKKKNGEENGK